MTSVDIRLDHLAIATRYAIASDQWPVAPRFSPADRWYHRIAQEAEYEVWLLTWLPGQGTDLHDHGGSAGAFHVISGSLTEDTLIPGSPPRDTGQHIGSSAREFGPPHIGSSIQEPAFRRIVPPTRVTARELGEGAGRRFGPQHIHRITNLSTRPAISVHVYAPALTTMTRYRIGPNGLDVVTVEKAGVQW